MNRHLLALSCCIMLVSCSSDAAYDSSYAFLVVTNIQSKEERRVCVNYEQWKEGRDERMAETPMEATGRKMKWWMDGEGEDVCVDGGRRSLQNGVVPLHYRLQNSTGLCRVKGGWKQYFQYQVDRLTDRNASVGLFLVNRSQQYFTQWKDYLFADFYDPDLNHSSIPLFFIYNHTFRDILTMGVPEEQGADLELRFYRPPSHAFDWSMAIIWFMAVFSLSLGGYWSGVRKLALLREEHKFETDRLKSLEEVPTENDGQRTPGSAEAASTNAPQPSSTPVNCCFLVFMVVVVVGVLMLGYYFRFVMVYVFNVLLVIGGTFAMFNCLTALLGPVGCGRCRVCMSLNDVSQSVFKREVFHWDCCHKRPMFRSILLFLFSATFSVIWFIFRRHAYAFILLDTINVCLCIHVIKGLRFPSLKWLVILLAVMFVYDLFMVFGTPFLTKDGCSVMVQVAVGTDCSASSGNYPVAPVDSNLPEILPMLFRVPRLSDPMLSCVDLSVELQFRPFILGLGDIIMPGFLVGYCFGVDMIKKRFFYGPIAVISYGAGLVVTFIALAVMKLAQPALIYLVPFTLIPVCLVALCRKEFGQLWKGVELEDSDSILPVVGNVEENRSATSAEQTDQ